MKKTVKNFKIPWALILSVLLVFPNQVLQAGETAITSSQKRYSEARSQARSEGCPPILLELVQEDKKDWLFFSKSQHEICEGYLSLDKGGAIYPTPQNLSAAFNSRFGDFGPEIKRTADSCAGPGKDSKLANSDKNEAVAKLYFAQSRLAQGQRGVIEGLVTLGPIVGKSDWKNSLACEDSFDMSTRTLCRSAKFDVKCKNPTTPHELYERQKRVEAKIAEFEKQRKELWLRASVIRTSESPEKKSLQEQMLALDILIAQQRAKIPWASGEVYKNTLECRPHSGCKNQENAIRAQLEADMKNLINSYRKIEQGIDCLRESALASCKSKQVREALALTPNYLSPLGGSPGKGSLALEQHMSKQQCLEDGKISEMEMTDKVGSAAVQAGISLAAVFTGGIAGAAARALEQGVISARAAETAIATARLTNVGMDLATISLGVRRAIVACAEQSTSEIKSSGAANFEKGLCNQNPVFNFDEADDQYDKCLQATLMAGTGTLMVGASGVLMRKNLATVEEIENAKNFKSSVDSFKEAVGTAGEGAAKTEMLNKASELSNPERLKAAQLVLARTKPLSKAQGDAILEAHDVGLNNGHGFVGDSSNYTQTELIQKSKILRRANFKADEVSQLMRPGITGRAADAESAAIIARQQIEEALKLAESAKYKLDDAQKMMKNFSNAAVAERKASSLDSSFSNPDFRNVMIQFNLEERALTNDPTIINRIRGGDLDSVSKDISFIADKMSKMNPQSHSPISGQSYEKILQRELDTLKENAQAAATRDSRGLDPVGDYEAWQMMRARIEITSHNHFELNKISEEALEHTRQELLDFVKKNKLEKQVQLWEKAENANKGI